MGNIDMLLFFVHYFKDLISSIIVKNLHISNLILNVVL